MSKQTLDLIDRFESEPVLSKVYTFDDLDAACGRGENVEVERFIMRLAVETHKTLDVTELSEVEVLAALALFIDATQEALFLFRDDGLGLAPEPEAPPEGAPG